MEPIRSDEELITTLNERLSAPGLSEAQRAQLQAEHDAMIRDRHAAQAHGQAHYAAGKGRTAAGQSADVPT